MGLVLTALVVGYVIGVLQNGINVNIQEGVITKNNKKGDPEYNKSVGLDYYTEYYEKTKGVTKL